jgi:NADH:ubiquinone oxidoreductase subunit K
MAWDPVVTVNFALCIVIFILGMVGYAKTKDTVPIYIGIAFLLFAVSHFYTSPLV